ncbi:hypothetical protein AVEN_257558-1 [Araneus ventricosus]|uniref:Uncharacterized protein n=1 Tax=Araneus ventricosus TaxID=182803 RepID=A0A4Y2PVP6_ARAVE|nr:hypothetical protein AVEN_257558-1 [Araneus ventricosus]
MGLEADNKCHDLVEQHSQELTTEELMELHCFPQQESCGGEFAIGGTGNSKATFFSLNKRKAESMGNCCRAHLEAL